MPDTALLRRRLIRALDLTPLALIGMTSVSCLAETAHDLAEQKKLEAAVAREQAAREAELARAEAEQAQRHAEFEREEAELERERADKTAEAAKAEAARLAELAKLDPLALSPEPQPIPHFSCPSGEWCGSKAIAKRYAGEGVPEHPDALECPGHLAQRSDGKARADEDPPGTMGYAYLDEAATKAGREQGTANLCCYDWGSYCGGGRPLLDEGQPKFATIERLESSRMIDDHLDPRIALGWLEDARMEHASIASFLRAEAELAALDAPASLRDACLRAADDERRHARDCFAIAAAHGQAWRPGELPHASVRRPSFEQLAVDTLLEGGIGETIAALMARRAARAAEGNPRVADVLEQIAVDELEHAALAWQTIAWALERGGDRVRSALLAAAARARPADFELPMADPNADQLAHHGRPDARAKARAIRDAWSELIDPMLAELAQRSCPSIATN